MYNFKIDVFFVLFRRYFYEKMVIFELILSNTYMYQIMEQTKHNCTGDKYMRKKESDSTE